MPGESVRSFACSEWYIAAQGVAIRFSTRELLIVVASLACLFAGYREFGLLGAAVVTLVVGIVLFFRGRIAKSTRIASTGISLSATSLLMLCVIMAIRIEFGIGPIYSASKYPFEFTEIVETLDADLGDAKISCIARFIDTEHVWRLTLAPELWERAIESYGLTELPVDKVPGSFWRSFPFRWRPTHRDGCRYFSSPNFPGEVRGPDGDHCLAMYDPTENRLYVWWKFNF